ncbi:MAG: hypothetical protein LKI76_04230 [Megasphaera sp.]|jgi:hypothetical protein|nr:hypothetical protein [Megasphaera sp.]
MWCGSNAIISVLTKAFGNMPYELYLQLEFKNINILEHSVDFRICLKTSLQGDKRGNSDMYSEVRDYLREKYEKTHNDKVFKRPSRLGNGMAMTVGECKILEEDKLADIKDKIRKAVEDYKKFTASFFFLITISKISVSNVTI